MTLPPPSRTFYLDRPTATPSSDATLPCCRPRLLQITNDELQTAMSFLREQLGEEELRHMLETLRAEVRAGGLGAVGGRGRGGGGLKWQGQYLLGAGEDAAGNARLHLLQYNRGLLGGGAPHKCQSLPTWPGPTPAAPDPHHAPGEPCRLPRPPAAAAQSGKGEGIDVNKLMHMAGAIDLENLHLQEKQAEGGSNNAGGSGEGWAAPK